MLCAMMLKRPDIPRRFFEKAGVRGMRTMIVLALFIVTQGLSPITLLGPLTHRFFGKNVMRALEMCTSSPTMQCRKPVGTLSVPHVIPQRWFATGTLSALDVSLYAQLIGRQTMGTDTTHAGRVLNHREMLWSQTSERIVLKQHACNGQKGVKSI